MNKGRTDDVTKLLLVDRVPFRLVSPSPNDGRELSEGRRRTGGVKAAEGETKTRAFGILTSRSIHHSRAGKKGARKKRSHTNRKKGC